LLLPVSKEHGATSSQLNEIRVLVGIAATIAIARACNRSEGHGCGTHIRVGLHRGAYLVDFIDGQLTSAFPHKYSVFFLSRHMFSPLFFLLHPLDLAHPITGRTYPRPNRLWAGV
jgi:hypothetical protein